MLDVYIIRHGETDWNKEKRVQGSTDIPLNEFGERLARVTADGLRNDGIRFDCVYSSPLNRAYKTAQILTEGTGLEIIKDERITEFSFGKAEGLTWDDFDTNPSYADVAKVFSDPLHYVPENGGETFEQVIARAEDFLEREIRPLEGMCKSVLVSCHGAITRALMLCVKHIPLEQFWKIYEPNCAVNLVKVKDGVFRAVYTGKIYYKAPRPGIV